MLLSKGLGGKGWGENGVSNHFAAGSRVVVRCGEAMGYVEVFCWTGFWGWVRYFEVVLGKGFSVDRVVSGNECFLSGDTV